MLAAIRRRFRPGMDNGNAVERQERPARDIDPSSVPSRDIDPFLTDQFLPGVRSVDVQVRMDALKSLMRVVGRGYNFDHGLMLRALCELERVNRILYVHVQYGP